MSTNQGKKLEISKKDDIYYLTGAINEHTSFDVPVPINSVLKLDLAAIDFINSIGTRSWVLFLRSHEGCDIQFHRVSLAMMSAISMMPMLFTPLHSNAGMPPVSVLYGDQADFSASFFSSFGAWTLEAKDAGCPPRL